jgi:hypothetical protein
VTDTETCTVTLVLDYDSLDCYLTAGHAGPHKGIGEGGKFFWAYDR